MGRALIYPFTLKGFNASVTMITSAGANGRALPWTTAAISLLIAFAVCDAGCQFIQVRPVATAVGHDPRLGETLAEIVPEVRVIVAEDADTAAREIVDAEAAFGWLGSDLLLKATKLRWLQAPQAAPPAGYYYPELIAHSVVVTNFREIFNDHIGAHILAFVLAFARGLHIFIPQQFRREWKRSPAESGDVVHLMNSRSSSRRAPRNAVLTRHF